MIRILSKELIEIEKLVPTTEEFFSLTNIVLPEKVLKDLFIGLNDTVEHYTKTCFMPSKITVATSNSNIMDQLPFKPVQKVQIVKEAKDNLNGLFTITYTAGIASYLTVLPIYKLTLVSIASQFLKGEAITKKLVDEAMFPFKSYIQGEVA